MVHLFRRGPHPSIVLGISALGISSSPFFRSEDAISGLDRRFNQVTHLGEFYRVGHGSIMYRYFTAPKWACGSKQGCNRDCHLMISTFKVGRVKVEEQTDTNKCDEPGCWTSFGLYSTMPGPCNTKKQKRARLKREKKSQSTLEPSYGDPCPDIDCDDALLAAPNIYDPGTGPRVRNAREFLTSYFAQPPSLNDLLCAEFAQEEILQMLCTILSEDMAIVCAVAPCRHS